MTAEFLIDTNIVLRHLLQDHPEQSPASTALLERIEAGQVAGWMTPMAVAEMVWVLSGPMYRLAREEIRDGLAAILRMPGLRVVEGEALVEALDSFAAFGVDFIDAYHAALLRPGQPVYSYDRDFDRIPGVTRVEPTA